MNWFLRFLRRHGRAWALVDFYGDVQMLRYFPLWVEPHIPTGLSAWLPNMMLHVFPGEPGGAGPDGESPHAHPWPSLGLVYRGEYTEEIDGKELRVNRAPALTFVSHKSFHRIVSAQPGTMTVFFHGFRRRRAWLLDRKQCAGLCEQCQAHGVTVCPKSKGVEPFRADIESEDVTHNPGTAWVVMDDTFEAKIAKRKSTLRRMGMTIPIRNADKAAVIRENAAKEIR